jgi:hypothetical protein
MTLQPLLRRREAAQPRPLILPAGGLDASTLTNRRVGRGGEGDSSSNE